MQTPSKTLSGSITCAVAAGERRDRANKNECAEKLKAIVGNTDSGSQAIGLAVVGLKDQFPVSTTA